MKNDFHHNDRAGLFSQLELDSVISHFKIIRKITSGSSGNIYHAKDLKLNRSVAIKFLATEFSSDQKLKEEFTEKIKAVASVNHPNIIKIFEYAEYEGHPYYVMEYIDGQTLTHYIKNEEFSLYNILDIAVQICEGLISICDSTVLRQIINPDNYLIDKRNHVYLYDFGIYESGESEPGTNHYIRANQLAFLAPEQLENQSYNCRSELFSFGVIFYEMLTGVNPFKRDNSQATKDAIKNDTPLPISEFRPGFPEEIQKIINMLLAKAPDDRYKHIKNLCIYLKQELAKLTMQHSQENLRQIIDLVPHMIFAKNEKGEFILANHAVAEAYGMAVEEIVGLKHDRLHNTPMEVDKMLGDDLEVIKTGYPKFIPEEKFTDTRGNTRILQTIKIPYKAVGSSEPAILGVAIDITEYKRASERLKESKRTLSTLLSNLPGMAYRCNNDRDWTMEFVSSGCRGLTGYEADDIINNKMVSYNDIIVTDFQEQVWNDVQKGVDNKKPFQTVYKIKTKDQKEKWVWEQGQGILSEDGEVLALEGFITDITDRMEMEAELRKTSEELKKEQESLIEKNIALKELLDMIEKERKDYQHQISQDIEKSLIPYINKLRDKLPDGEIEDYNEIEFGIKTILNKDIDDYREKFETLSPREAEIAELIKQGMSTKQITEMLNLSQYTVHKHREQIRKKLGITNKRINLSIYLQLHS